MNKLKEILRGGGYLKNNRKPEGKKVYYLVLLVATILIVAGSVAYAYFTAVVNKTNEENKLTNVKAKVLVSATFDYGKEIGSSSALPGYQDVKEMKLTSTCPEEECESIVGTINVTEDIPEVFGKDIEWAIYEVEEENRWSATEGEFCTYTEHTNGEYYVESDCPDTTELRPILTNKSYKKNKNIEINGNKTTYYYLVLTYKNNDEVDQNGEAVQNTQQGESFSVTIDFFQGENVEENVETVINGDSILQILEERDDLKTGYYDFVVNSKNYSVHLINYDESQTFSAGIEPFGSEEDISKNIEASEGVSAYRAEAENMVIVRVQGDLTVEENAVVEPIHTSLGGPKGFTLYVTGTLEIEENGVIDNSHGAYAQGEDVYLWKNSNENYEVVPSEGAGGGSGVSSAAGNPGTNGSKKALRATAGGGAGGGYGATGGSGGSGTSYSGGTGGGAGGRTTGGTGSATGGIGGAGIPANGAQYDGGGAGNPGGPGSGYGGALKGDDGTGGLLIVYADKLTNNGKITAEGANGGYGPDASGGGSGGGSINLFYKDSTSITGTCSAKGGNGSTGGNKGGAGGEGTTTISLIEDGELYNSNEINKLNKYLAVVDGIVNGKSILQILENNNLNSGHYLFKTNGKVYPVHLINYEGDQTFNEGIEPFGDAQDVASGTSENQMAEYMVIVKVNGNLTVKENAKVEPYYTEYGGPKGFTLYVTGTLTNNGTIDNSHGAYAQGENVYLYKNSNGDYEYIPAEGSAGGEAVSLYGSLYYSPGNHYYNSGPGNPGTDGNNRSLAGGGSGGLIIIGQYTSSSGAGTKATSYSGGTGGGGYYGGAAAKTGFSGSLNGGSGGNAYIYEASSTLQKVAGGAGNPGGLGYASNSKIANKQLSSDTNGSTGTGGLLVIYTNNLENNGLISANGSSGGSARSGGGGSGGGSINVFYKNLNKEGNISVLGGIGGTGNAAGEQPDGGAGGEGTITYTQIN